LIPFNIAFVDNPKKKNEKQVDPDLPEKLKAEGSGILAWLVRGCLKWQRYGLNSPESIRAATMAYRKEEDLIGKFINDRCVVKDTAEAKGGELYSAYHEWCEKNGHCSMSGTNFGKDLKERFDSYTKGTVRYVGIGLRNK
jgi:putative DNA primase/helicase